MDELNEKKWLSLMIEILNISYGVGKIPWKRTNAAQFYPDSDNQESIVSDYPSLK